MAEEATHRCCMLLLGILSQRGWSEEQLLDLFDEMARLNSYAIDGVLPCKDVQDIIGKYNGMRFERKWY